MAIFGTSGNNFLGNWFYNNLQNKVNNDPYLRNEVYGGGARGFVAGTGAGLGLGEFGVSEARASELPAGPTTTLLNDYSGGSNTTNNTNTGGTTTTTPTTGDVLGDSTSSEPSEPSGPSYEDIMREQINSGWGNYFNQLDQMLGGLEGQRTAQEGIARTSFDTSLTDLGLQKEQGVADLDKQRSKAEIGQVKTLKDISDNIRNLMQAGNTYLGAKGAGDSSAVDQYSYALTKMGSKARGDVKSQTRSIMSEIDDRESRLQNVYMQEKNRLQGELNTKIGEIAQWFNSAQNELRSARASGELGRSQDLQQLATNMYNTALQQLNNLQNVYNSRTQALESWAISNASNIQQLRDNMAQVSTFNAPQQTYAPIAGTPQFDSTGSTGPVYGGSGFTGLTDDQKRLLGLA